MGRILPALAEDQSNSENGNPPLGISANTTLGVRSSTKCSHYCNVQIINKDRVEEANRENQGLYSQWYCRRAENAVIPDGTVI